MSIFALRSVLFRCAVCCAALIFCASAFCVSAWADPRIGVSGQSASSPSVIALMAVLRYAGAAPMYIGDHAHHDAAADLSSLDGLVVAGNNYDLDPDVYGQTQQAHTINENAKGADAQARAAYEYQAIELALKHRLPLLAICGGMQRLNVGGAKETQGTLIQHVPHENQWKKGVPPYLPSDTITISQGSLLSGMAQRSGGAQTWKENSLHHQAADKIRQGFRISARNQDGTTEAIEPDPSGPYAGQFALGVQWHPEYGASTLQRGIIGEFIRATQRYHSEKTKR